MKLISGKITGHFVLQNSDWFSVHEKITTITAPAGSGKTTLLKALRSINPPPSCLPDPAPFAAFPHYVNSGNHTRKVIPAKKTAVIAIFICDYELRNSLAAIDPVFLKTDRIEVGRRLDNSRWLTFVEIAGSSRWSELSPVMDKLRQRFSDSRDDSLLGPLRQSWTTPAPTDRIKGELATHLNELLDHLAERAVGKDDRSLVQQGRFIVNRASRYIKAREITSQTLPIFVYLREDELLSTTIDVARLSEKMRQTTEIPCPCADLFLLELLGFDQTFLHQATTREIALRLRDDADQLATAGRELSQRLLQYLPASGRCFSVTMEGGVITLHPASGPEKQFCPPEISSHWRWMLSCAVSACYISEVLDRQPIFLLDEPDAAPRNRGEKIELETMLRRLSDSCQVTACITREDFLADTGKHYRLIAEGEKGYQVTETYT